MPHRTLLTLPLALLFLVLTHTSPTAASPRAVPRQEPEGDDDFFAEFIRPREGDVLVTGSVVEVSWRTGDGGGQVIFEVAEGDPELRHFVYVDYDIDYAPGAHNWTVPANLTPGLYSLRLANSSDPSIYADSPSFEVIHAAPAPTSRPKPPSGGGTGSLTRADTIGLGVGLGVVGLLVICGVWLFWRRKRGMGTGRRRRRRSGDSGMARGAFPGDGPVMGAVKTEEDKLPEGVVSAWAPEGRVSPVELPAETIARLSREDGERESSIEGRLELSGCVGATSPAEEPAGSREEEEGSLERGNMDREGRSRP